MSNLLKKPLVQILMVGVMALMVFGILQKAGQWAVITALVLVALIGATVYLLQFQQPLAKRLYGMHPWVRTYFDFMCYGLSLPKPVDEKTVKDLFRLKEPADYDTARQELCRSVRGMDGVIAGMLQRLRENQLLRTTVRTVVRKPPLGFFLLAGQESIGKKHLARRLTKAVYHNGEMLALDMRDYATDATGAQLFGAPNADSIIGNALLATPCLTLLLENIEAVPPSIMSRIQEMLAHGVIQMPQGGRVVPIDSCVIILTTGRAFPELAAVNAGDAPPRQKRANLQELLHIHAGLPAALTEFLDDIFVLPFPNLRARAEVVARLLSLECQKHRKTLRWVNPQLLLAEALAVTPETGYAALQARVAAILRDPMIQANLSGAEQLSLEMPGDMQLP